MKLLLLIYSGPTPQRLSALLDRHHVSGYTELGDARGAGVTGRLLGTRAWPGSATVLFTVVAEPHAAAVIQELQTEKAQLSTGEHLHVAVLPVESYF